MPKITITLILALCVMLPACSSVSLPSLPWSGSAAKADPTAEALFEEGTRNFNDKKYVRAIDSFTKIKTDHPFSPLVTQAELKVADAHYLNEQFPEAINLFKEFQDLHPTSEHLPFVTLRLGQAHFDQFTAVDREQKNTELAKGYFEAVITKYPKSPQAAIAKTKLAQAVEYLAEHEFSAAEFYFKQQKFAAARDRFEEIVRKYRDTPTAVKSLYFLGESYRQEKNGPRATLAYEALIQRYPQSKYAADARTQLALVEKEKRDPLDLLLMRDRRPGAAPAPEVKEDPALAKLKDLNLVAKNEVVYEEPGAEKGFFRRVTEKINPFSSSSSSKFKPRTLSPSQALDLMAKKTAKQPPRATSPKPVVCRRCRSVVETKGHRQPVAPGDAESASRGSAQTGCRGASANRYPRALGFHRRQSAKERDKSQPNAKCTGSGRSIQRQRDCASCGGSSRRSKSETPKRSG